MANTPKHHDDKPTADDAAKARPRPASAEEGAAPTEAKEREATEEQKRKADEGHPDQYAQINLINDGGVPAIRAALDSLPAIPALDGLKANWEHYSRDELVKALKGLPLPKENAGALATRDALVKRLESGELRR